jgi:hypothetical protein
MLIGKAQWDDDTKINMSFVSSSESERGNINLVFVFIYSLVVKYF